MKRKIKKILIANRSEIAIRVMRAANELQISTVAIYADEDRLALHRFKADESYRLGGTGKPVASYLDINRIISIALDANVDAIHPGYGFLSENPDFVRACNKNKITFIGPTLESMEQMGNKVTAKRVAKDAGVPTIPASGKLPLKLDAVKEVAKSIGYPLMLKASWGGGGRGMRVIRSEYDIADQIDSARRESLSAFGNDELYFEKLIENAKHIEVQILGDQYGNLVHLFERDCTVQRRNQKVVERAPAAFLKPDEREMICQFALKIGKQVGYQNAGTVEFLYDCDASEFYFIEVNPRIQVEHTVTEEITGIDIVKAQIKIAEGEKIGPENVYLPEQKQISFNGFALQCRITTENPENKFIPDYGRILNYRSPAGFGIRLDGGTAYSGAEITPYYDSLLSKLTVWAQSEDEAISRMHRALREFRVRGVATNLLFLEQLINHKDFRTANYTTNFIDSNPDLFHFPPQRDRASRILNYLGEVTVNGREELKNRLKPSSFNYPLPPEVVQSEAESTKDIIDSLGPEGFSNWLYHRKEVMITDTTMRDAHQSLLATRFRTSDLLSIASTYNKALPNLLSVECWGGATFDVAMRFLTEDPWDRLEQLRKLMPAIPLQMLLRSSNAVGYTNYPDNIVTEFVAESAKVGIDIFRIFDSLNWSLNMKVAMHATVDVGKICEGTICYSGDMLSKYEKKYNLKYYLSMARSLKSYGAHVIGIKDMAGVCKPDAVATLVEALKNEIQLPVHFHTHDTSGVSAATVLSAISAGVDAIDLAMDSMSGMTSQPNLGSILGVLKDSPKDPKLDTGATRKISRYWELVRENYVAFESEIRASTSDVYYHAMPGGQYTNLREQAKSLGVAHRWPEIAERYAEVNELFGNIIKVTPTSKVVGDMALAMVMGNFSKADVLDPTKEIPFPDSVIAMFKGELGKPKGGFPRALTKKILKSKKPLSGRPGAELKPINLDKALKEIEKKFGRKLQKRDALSYVLYPKVFEDYHFHRKKYSNLSILNTPIFFYGLNHMEEVAIEIEKGKVLVVRLLGMSKAPEKGICRVFFELNGQPRTVNIDLIDGVKQVNSKPKSDKKNPQHIGSPMPGKVIEIYVTEGNKINIGDPLISIEAMKMETLLRADRKGRIQKILISIGDTLDAQDLILTIK
jgi:pyruvate carboxylase